MNKWSIILIIAIAALAIAFVFVNLSAKDAGVGSRECASDSDCVAAGCSGQLCAPVSKAKDIITTCEIRPEYGCLNLTRCECVKGGCSWQNNTNYAECLISRREGNET